MTAVTKNGPRLAGAALQGEGEENPRQHHNPRLRLLASISADKTLTRAAAPFATRLLSATDLGPAISLFSGAGGMDLGAETVSSSLEAVPPSRRSSGTQCHPGSPKLSYVQSPASSGESLWVVRCAGE
jgi:hypothetical protein